MAYNSNKKATELEMLTSATINDADVSIVGDADDLGRAKGMTWADYKTAIKTFLDTYYYQSGGGDVPIADGGTGASTAGDAIHNLLDGTVLTSATVATDDKVLIQDTDGGNVLKTVTAQSIADLHDDAVDMVNGQTGSVVLDADDIDDSGTTNKFVTATDITNLGNLSGTNSGDEPDATDSVKGIVELATAPETLTGTDIVRATTPAGVKAVADTKVAKAGDTMTGTLTLATGTMAVAPLKMVSGVNLTTPEAGAFEYDGTNLYFSVA